MLFLKTRSCEVVKNLTSKSDLKRDYFLPADLESVEMNMVYQVSKQAIVATATISLQIDQIVDSLNFATTTNSLQNPQIAQPPLNLYYDQTVYKNSCEIV